jgi:uncharacterized membrane protein
MHKTLGIGSYKTRFIQVDKLNKMEVRPKIKLTLSPFDKALDRLSKCFLLLLLGLTVYSLWKLPSIIPIHYGDSGHADKYGKKVTLLIYPILGTIIYVVLGQIGKYPEIFNYITKITADNAPQQYGQATRVIRLLKLAISIIFVLIVLFTNLTTIGITDGLGRWFLPTVVALILIPTIVLITQGLMIKHKTTEPNEHQT